MADGYVRGIPYTKKIYNSCLPEYISFSALLNGEETAFGDTFNYIDLGCGFGLTTILAALSYPRARFVGVDFDPTHVAYANKLSRKLGLANVEFVCESFGDISDRLIQKYGYFDIAVSHGVLTWIDGSLREVLISDIGKLLKAGGVAAVSYNCAAGWTARTQFHNLLFALNDIGAVKEDTLDETAELYKTIIASSRFKRIFPNEEAKFSKEFQDHPAYLMHEYANKGWRPEFFSEVLERFQTLRMQYLGSGTLAENFFHPLPAEVKVCLENRSREHAESILDVLISKNFRRDLFSKARSVISPSERRTRLLKTRVKLCAYPLVIPESGFNFLGYKAKATDSFNRFSEILGRNTDEFVLEEYFSDLSPDDEFTLSCFIDAGILRPWDDSIELDVEQVRLLNTIIAEEWKIGSDPAEFISPRNLARINLGSVNTLILTTDYLQGPFKNFEALADAALQRVSEEIQGSVKPEIQKSLSDDSKFLVLREFYWL